VGIASVAACAEAPPERSIDDFLQEFTDEWVRMDPDLAVRAQYFDGGEQDRLSRRLTPATVAWKRDRIQLAREGLAELGTFDADSLTDGQLLSADVMRWQLQSLVASEPYLDYEFPLQQFNGVNVTVPSALTVVHPVRNEREAENYAARLRQVDDRMDEATAESQRLAARGVLPPRFILESTIAQMEQFIAPSPAENPLVTVFATKMQAAKLAASTQETLLRDAISVVEGEVYSAWQKAISTLRAQISSATDDAGLWRFGDGADLYADRLRFFTTTSLSAEEIHQTGIDEVSRIEAEMDQRLRELGYEDGSVRDRVAQLEADVAYPNTDKGRAAIMADIDDILADALGPYTVALRRAAGVPGRCRTVSGIHVGNGCRAVQSAAAGRIPPGHLSDASPTQPPDQIGPSHDRLPRERPGTSLSDRPGCGESRPSCLQAHQRTGVHLRQC
jgi:uncharacterized protein (DUF885 family)